MKEVLVKLGISPSKADLIIQEGTERRQAKYAERKAAREAKGNDGAFSMKALNKTQAQRAELKAAKLARMEAAKAQAPADPTPAPAPKAKKSKKNPI